MPAPPIALDSVEDSVAYDAETLLQLRALALRTAVRTGLRLSDAEDVAQEVLLALLGRTGDRPRNPEAWVRVVAKRASRRHRRELDRVMPLEAVADATTTPHPEGTWLRRLDLEKRLSSLPSRERSLLLLHHQGGVDSNALAATWGLTRGSMKVLLWRARRRARGAGSG